VWFAPLWWLRCCLLVDDTSGVRLVVLVDHKTREIAKLGPKRPRVGSRLIFWSTSDFSCDSKSGVKRIPTIGRGGPKM